MCESADAAPLVPSPSYMTMAMAIGSTYSEAMMKPSVLSAVLKVRSPRLTYL